MKITFKKQPKQRGLAGIGHPYPPINIKVDGKKVGIIYPPDWQTSGWSFQIAVEKSDINEDQNPNCSWKWLTYSGKSLNTATEEQVRLWAKLQVKLISKQHQLHFFED